MPNRRVLIVDDDPEICQLVDDILADVGQSTVKAQSDVAAYSALRTLPVFKALIVDVNLGKGTTGFDIARFAPQSIPGIKVVYISGDASEASFRAFGVPDSAFLQKPFSPAGLLRALDIRLSP